MRSVPGPVLADAPDITAFVSELAYESRLVGVVAELLGQLLAGTWTDRKGVARPVTLEDVLVVTPYNNEVGRLRHGLPAGARIGTVDKFQGQEAPVVVYSMASSSAADAPRGVGCLYDVHRLNVAGFRAQALAVIVASPRLLDASAHSPEQLREVNALCRFVEFGETAVTGVV